MAAVRDSCPHTVKQGRDFAYADSRLPENIER